MLKLLFNLRHQSISLTNPGVTVASDSKNYLVAKFNTISDDWETPLSAIFVSTVDKIAYTVLVGQSPNLEPDECFIPWEVLKDSGDVYVSVFSGDLHTTNTAKFAVVKSGYIEGEIPPPPTPTVYEQILEELENKQDVIHLDNAIDEVYNPNGHYVLYYFDTQEVRHNIFDFEVFQELTNEKIYEILDSTLQGDSNIAPSLYVMTNQQGDYLLVYEDSEDNLHTIFNFSNLPSGTSNYNDLSNRPQINGHTLFGDQTSEDLGLQKELTAGTNIEIAADGTISASGGVTSYNDLTDKPIVVIENQTNTLSRSLVFDPYEFTKTLLGSNGVALSNAIFESFFDFYSATPYNFSQLSKEYIHTGCFYELKNRAKNIPVEFSDATSEFYIFNFGERYTPYEKLVRVVTYSTTSGIKTFIQFYSVNYNYEVINASAWQEIGGGSQIVSGVVNQNGTITFTDSDGETFNTSGNNIVTSVDQQINMGYDSGGFYFLFDDGNEGE